MAKKILIIDDEPNLVVLLEARLKTQGYEILTAYDGQSGLEMAKKHKPDLIILDLMLPKIDGHKVCGLLKNDTRYAKIPIILFTARAQDSDRQMAKELGADAYITKPFESKVLLSKVEELLLNRGDK
jgi:DNA-binding response OmpR family regulator